MGSDNPVQPFCEAFDETRHEFLRACMPEPPAALVELCCGDGSHVSRLLAEGYAAYGVELDRDLIALARGRHPQLGRHLIHGEMLEVFDLVRSPLALACCCGFSLSTLAGEEEVASVLLQLHDLAYPGGTVVVDFPNADRLAGHFATGLELLEEPTANGMQRSWQQLEDEPQRVRETLRLELDGTEPGRRRSLLLLTRQQIAELLPEGVAPQFLGDYSGGSWDADSELTIVRFGC